MAPSAAPGTDERVQLVDEQDDVAAGLDLLEHLLEALFEITAVARTGHEGAEVERVELLAGQSLGHVVGDDALREALDDGGLADARLTDEHRVVLGAARQHLHDALDLAIATDDRVELLLPGERGEVATELVEHGRAGGGFGCPGAEHTGGGGFLAAEPTRAQQLDDLLTDPAEVGAEALQDGGGHAFALAHDTEEHVLGADVVVTELQRLAQRELEDLLGPRREGRRAGRGCAGRTDGLLDLLAHGFEGDAERLERLGGRAFALVNEAEQDVLGPDEVVVEQPGLFLGQDEDPSGPVGESFEQVASLSAVAVAMSLRGGWATT